MEPEEVPGVPNGEQSGSDCSPKGELSAKPGEGAWA
jgi:hypothetical protein